MVKRLVKGHTCGMSHRQCPHPLPGELSFVARLLIPWWVSALGSNHIPSGIASWRGRAKSWSLCNISAYHFLKRSVLGGVAPWIDGEERNRRGSQHKAPSMAVRPRQTAPWRFLAGRWSLRTHHTSSNRHWRIEEVEKEEIVIIEASSPLFTLVKGSLWCMLRELQGYWTGGTRYYSLLLSPSVRLPTRGRSKLTEGSCFCLLTSWTKISRAQGQLWLYL